MKGVLSKSFGHTWHYTDAFREKVHFLHLISTAEVFLIVMKLPLQKEIISWYASLTSCHKKTSMLIRAMKGNIMSLFPLKHPKHKPNPSLRCIYFHFSFLLFVHKWLCCLLHNSKDLNQVHFKSSPSR